MKNPSIRFKALAAVCCWAVAAALLPIPALAQTCAPLDNGRLANVYHEGTLLYFEPVVEFREMVLTISGPCEDIVRTFGPKDEISFDIREIERVTDGHYNWTLQRVASIDEGLQQELQEARGSGKEDGLWWNAFQAGKIPDGPYTDSGAFSVERGAIIDPASGEEKVATVAKSGSRASGLAGAAVAGGVAGGEAAEGNGNTLATKDFVINDDLIVIGSTCVGFDCVNGEVFSFDTIRLKENNLRIKFQDTSGGSFPTRDWEIEVNSSANGGQSHFRINDVDGARSPFTIEAAAPSHSLYTDSSGRVGLGTSNPVLELHVVDGDSPALRLEQDASSGFQAQTWDIAGNETNFFVRDVTSGSRLPFRIRPGAPSNSIHIDAEGEVGLGTASPDRPLDVVTTGAPDNTVLEVQNDGAARIRINNSSNGEVWNIGHQNPGGTGLVFSDVGDADSELLLDVNGNLTITGEIFTDGSCSAGCDLVFDPGYELESIAEHAARMLTDRHLPAVGPTSETGPFNLSKMTGGMLNELEKAHLYIVQLDQRLADSERENQDLRVRLEQLEERVASGFAGSDR